MKNIRLIFLLMIVVMAGSLVTLNSSFKTQKKKNIGLQLYSVRDSIGKNVPSAIEKVGSMGYTFVEPASYSDGKIYGMDPVAFRYLCAKNGMKVLSSHVNQTLPTEASFDKTMAWWDLCIETHLKAGAKYLVQSSMGGDAYKSLAALKKWCEYFNAVGERCNAKGIRFGYHNHNREFSTQLEGQTLYDFMLDNTDPSKVMFQLDLYWCVDGGKNPVDYFNKYPGRFELWHIKDKEEIGASGKMDFESIWKSAKKSGMKYGIVEVERYNFDQFTSCRKSIDFLNGEKYVKMPIRK